jgi:hypothetical protein
MMEDIGETAAGSEAVREAEMNLKCKLMMALVAVFVMAAAVVTAAGAEGNRGVAAGVGARVPVNHKLPTDAQVMPLSLEVTREMQMADLGADPSGAAALQRAIREMNAHPTTALPPGSPWVDGIAVSPLSPIHAVGATWEQANVYMESFNSFFDPWHPLPTPGNDYITMVSVNDPSRFFFDLLFHWPVAGYYMISVNAVSEFPTTARPRFGHAFAPNPPMTTMSPNAPVKPTRWTVLVLVPTGEVSKAMAAYGFFPSNPAKVGCFIQAYVGKVTIRKL